MEVTRNTNKSTDDTGNVRYILRTGGIEGKGHPITSLFRDMVMSCVDTGNLTPTAIRSPDSLVHNE
jgi:hypothetical protein